MADDVTKKDLQTLEKNFNKQVLDLKKRVDDMQKQLDDQRSEFNKGLDEENKITVNTRHDLEKKIESVDSRCNDLQNGINTLARAHADLAKKVGK